MISSEDFNLLQEQLISLKREKYEYTEREKKLNNEIKLLKEQNEEDGGKKKSSLFSDIVSRKGKMNEIQEENESLKKTLQQNSIVHQEQNEALKHNIKSLFETNSQLEEQILLLKKDIQSYVIKSEDQQNIVRKLQVDIAELHCTNEELELKLQNSNNSNNNNNSNSNNSNVSLDSIVEILNSFSLENEELKSKITELFNSSSDATTAPPSPVTPKEIIFHPLGEPEYNPDNEKEKQKLRDTIKHLMEQIKENEIKSSKSSIEIKELLDNNEQLQSQINQWQEKYRNAEINRVKIEERLEGEIKKIKEDYNNIETEKQKLEQDFGRMQNALQVSSKKFEESIEQADSTFHLEKEKLEKLLNEKTQELTNQKLNYDRIISDLNDKSNIFKLSRDEYLQNYNQSIDEIKIKDQVIESKSIEIDQLSQRIKELENSLQEEKNQLKQNIEMIKDNKNEFESLSTKMKKLEEKLALERSSFDSLNQKFNVVTLENNNFEKLTKEMEKQIEELEKEKQSLESTNQLNNTTIDENKNEIEQQLNQLKEKELLIQQQSDEIKEKSIKLEEFDNIQQELVSIKESYQQSELKLKEVNERLSSLEPEFEKVKSDYDSACIKITQLEVALVDAETEKKISEKKNIKMIKDLKMELSQSRDSINQLSQSAAASGQATPVGAPSPSLQRSAGSVSLPTTPNVTPLPSSRHQRTVSSGSAFQLSSSSSSSPLPSSSLPHSLSSSNVSSLSSPIKPPHHPNNNNYHHHSGTESTLRNDLETLGRKLGELGTENYKLEEKNRTLEQTNQMLLQEIDKKSKVVRFYISKTQLGRATTEDEKTKRLKGGISGSFWRNNDPKIVAEMVEKMEVMLQENILKNMQLTESIEYLSSESSKLKTEIDVYKTLLKENSIDISSNFKNLHNHLNPTTIINNNSNNNNNNDSSNNISIQVSDDNLNDC